jgi:putative colanic acid biosynthesis acetyltransferase WcaF
LGPIEICENATVAQEAYLCTGTHDFTNPAMPLQIGPIKICENAFVGARSMILPTVTVERFAVVGAQSVVTRDVPASTIVAGNPARTLAERKQVPHD